MKLTSARKAAFCGELKLDPATLTKRIDKARRFRTDYLKYAVARGALMPLPNIPWRKLPCWEQIRWILLVDFISNRLGG